LSSQSKESAPRRVERTENGQNSERLCDFKLFRHKELWPFIAGIVSISAYPQKMGFLPAGRLPPNSTRQENSAKMRQNEDTKKLSNNPVMKASISLEADLLKNRLADFELNHQMSSDPQWMRPMSAFALSQCTKLLQK